MTGNEKIVRWLNFEFRGERLTIEEDCEGIVVYWAQGVSHMGWSPSTDITLWHGDNGLLAKIEEKLSIEDFGMALMDQLFGKDCWDLDLITWDALFDVVGRDANDLAAALCEVIPDES